MSRADIGKALMLVGVSLAITLLGAFLLVTYGEGGGPTKAATLFAVQVAMWSVFVVGYHLRFTPAKGDYERAAKARLLQFLRGARHIEIMSDGVLRVDQK